jgi:hypothetical protein
VSRGDLEDIIGANLACRAVSQQDAEPARDNDSHVARLAPFGSDHVAVVDRPPPSWLIHLPIDGNVTDLDSVGMHTSVSEDTVGGVQILAPSM